MLTIALILVLVVNYILLLLGTRITTTVIDSSGPNLDKPYNLFPITILKPLKGRDPGLKQNLESFFLLDYPKYDLVFSVADMFDPAREVVEELIRKYPRVSAQLIVGQEYVGLNPKVNNLVKGYENARYDFILISDSNIKVEPDYLKRIVSHWAPEVGVVTGIVSGSGQKGFGGELEAVYLNSFYARAINLAYFFGFPCVVGKSLLFRKQDLDRTGGMKALGNYINEDHQIGDRIAKLGLKTVLMSLPIPQNIGKYSFLSFWNRHLRWSRIRKTMAPFIYLLDPLMSCIPLAVLGVVLCRDVEQSFWFLCFHLGFWYSNDLVVAQRMVPRLSYLPPIHWFLRECLSFPLWLTAMIGQTVSWRGHEIKIGKGGIVKPLKKRPGNLPSKLDQHTKKYYGRA